jgi:hypothetical protein
MCYFFFLELSKMVKVFPAMVMVPLRLVVLVFSDTEYLTVALPAPLLAEVILIQVRLLDAVH